MLQTFRKLRSIEAPDRVKLHVGVMLLGILVSALEVVGIGLVFPLILIFADASRIADFPALVRFREATSLQSEPLFLSLFAAVIVFVSMGRLGAKALYTYYQARVSLHSAQLVAQRLLEGYMRMPHAQFVRRDFGSLIRNITVLPYGPFSSSVMALINIASDSLVAGGVIILLLVVQPLALGAGLAVIGGLTALIYPVLRRRNRSLGADTNRLLASRLAVAQQSLGDMRLLRVFGAEDYFLRASMRTLDAYVGNSWRIQVISSLPGLLIEGAFILGLIATVVVLYFGASGSSEVLASLALFAAAAIRLLAVGNRVLNALNTLHRHEAGVDTLVEELGERWEVQSPAEAGVVTPLPFEREIKLANVSYRYDTRETGALDRVDLTIRKGEMLGIVGTSGAGKSTLADVLLTIALPTEGAVTVDGVPIAQAPARWRQNVAVVPQRIFILDDTIRRNVAYGVRGRDIDDGAVWEALREAQLEEAVRALPQGVETRLSGDGNNLSGGQVQRLGIARALYHRRPVIILDEATSALDAETEHALTRVLQDLKRTHTLIVISHRLTTLRSCDRVVLLRDGRLDRETSIEELVRETSLALAENSPPAADRLAVTTS